MTTRFVQREGLPIARALMVAGPFATTFLVMAFRGDIDASSATFTLACIMLAVLPTVFLWLRIRVSKTHADKTHFNINGPTTSIQWKMKLLLAVALVLPFHGGAIDAASDMLGTAVALALAVFVVWRLNLYYVNLYFFLRGYRAFSISPPDNAGPHDRTDDVVLLTRREHLHRNDSFVAYRLTNSVFLEEPDGRFAQPKTN